MDSNGLSSAVFGGGIRVTDGASATIRGNTITTNFGDGILVSDGAFARVEDNTIEFNGRATAGNDGFGEAGIRVAAAVVQANGNVNRNPLNISLIVEDGGVYRTGVILNRGQPDNPFGFEEITAGAAGFAVIVNQGSQAVLRQVNVTGNVIAANASLLTIRGDERAPDTPQATLVGDATALVKSVIRLPRSVDVTGTCLPRFDSFCEGP